jgi:hypothetical protein
MLRRCIDDWKAAMIDRKATMAAWHLIPAIDRAAFDAARAAHRDAVEREELAAHDTAVLLVIELGEYDALTEAMAPFQTERVS